MCREGYGCARATRRYGTPIYARGDISGAVMRDGLAEVRLRFDFYALGGLADISCQTRVRRN